jgi:ubiquinone/menaquinone biosynthesis C-methylase UbiE
MDARDPKDIILDDEKYTELLNPIGGTLINPYEKNSQSQNPIEDGLIVSQHDLKLLKSSDIVLADLSIPNYQYVGCLFEIVHAAYNEIPVILVEGKRDFHNRYFIQAYCDFITETCEEAIEYIRRAHTKKGIEKQMDEMHAYYDEIAENYHKNHNVTNRYDKGEIDQERETLRYIIKRYVKGKTFQIGIGTGDWTSTICKTANRVIGIDQSKRMIDEARNNLFSYSNISFLHGDIFKIGINTGPFDCVVIYFLLSLLPSCRQRRLLSFVQEIMKPDGLLIIADTRKICDFPSVGFGRRQIQKRRVGNRLFTLYKEHFYSDSLVRLLQKEGLKIVDSSCKSVWFSWAVSCIPK